MRVGLLAFACFDLGDGRQRQSLDTFGTRHRLNTFCLIGCSNLREDHSLNAPTLSQSKNLNAPTLSQSKNHARATGLVSKKCKSLSKKSKIISSLSFVTSQTGDQWAGT